MTTIIHTIGDALPPEACHVVGEVEGLLGDLAELSLNILSSCISSGIGGTCEVAFLENSLLSDLGLATIHFSLILGLRFVGGGKIEDGSGLELGGNCGAVGNVLEGPAGATCGGFGGGIGGFNSWTIGWLSS